MEMGDRHHDVTRALCLQAQLRRLAIFAFVTDLRHCFHRFAAMRQSK